MRFRIRQEGYLKKNFFLEKEKEKIINGKEVWRENLLLCQLNDTPVIYFAFIYPYVYHKLSRNFIFAVMLGAI